MRLLALANQKGGVGKTTASINLASLWATKAKVLLVDMDPQGNASAGVGVYGQKVDKTITDVLKGECPAAEAVVGTGFDRLFVLPSHVGLAGLEAENLAITRLRDALNGLDFDFIVVDCPPSLGRLTLNVLALVERVLVPIKPGQFSLTGLQQLFLTVINLRLRQVNARLKILGLFYNEVQTNTNLFRMVDKALKKVHGDLLLETVVPGNVHLGEAQILGEPINIYDSEAKGYEAFLQLAEEVLRRW